MKVSERITSIDGITEEGSCHLSGGVVSEESLVRWRIGSARWVGVGQAGCCQPFAIMVSRDCDRWNISWEKLCLRLSCHGDGIRGDDFQDNFIIDLTVYSSFLDVVSFVVTHKPTLCLKLCCYHKTCKDVVA